MNARSLVRSLARSVTRIAVAVLIIAGALYISACALLYLKQRSLLYAPTSVSNVSDAESISLETDGETLRIWIRPVDSPNAVIYFGGNAQDVGLSLGALAKALPNQNLYLVNYRGYGGSTGSPSEKALFADALAVYDLVHAKYPNVSVIGRSLGTGVAVYLASMRKVDKLVLGTPYDSIENVAKIRFRFFPISLLLQDKFDSVSRARNITAKTLVILAENDSLIPRANSEALIAQFPPDQIVTKTIKGSTHGSIEISNGREYYDLLAGFL